MTLTPRHRGLFALLSGLLLLALLSNIAWGQVAIPLGDVLQTLLGQTPVKSTWSYIILEFRIPKALTAILVGMGLSICGLLMQTLFRNPLAGPYVLGLSSGSSLGVALVLMGAGVLPSGLYALLTGPYGLVTASCLGSLGVMALVLVLARKLRDSAGLLIVGLMFGSFTAAAVSVLTYFSSAEQLQRFTFWSMGNLGNMTYAQIGILTVCFAVGLLLSLQSIKALDGLLLGENYAASLGISLRKSRLYIIWATALLCGSITAFVGPIAFIGLAVPHLAKLLFQTSKHGILLGATLLIGAIIMLVCDTVAQMPGFDFTLPINAITSLVGAPVVIGLIIRKKALL